MSDIIEVVSDDAVSTVIEVIERGPQGPAGSGGGLEPIAANTLLGNPTGATANPVAMTPAEVSTLLNLSGTYLALAGGTLTGQLVVERDVPTNVAIAASVLNASLNGTIQYRFQRTNADFLGSLVAAWRGGTTNNRINIETYGSGDSIDPLFAVRGTNNGSACAMRSTYALAWTSNANASTGTIDVQLVRDAANVLALRNALNPQAFLIDNTWTSSTQRETGFFKWVSNVFCVGTEKGTLGGTARRLELQTDGTTRMSFEATSGNIDCSPDTDQRLRFGRAILSSLVADNIHLSHFDHATTTNYALRQEASGAVHLNAPTGQIINVSINGVISYMFRDSQIHLGSSQGTSPSLFSYNGVATTSPVVNGRGLSLYGRNNTTNGIHVAIGGESFIETSGNNVLLRTGSSFSPASGTATYATNLVIPIINQTGGANGVTQGVAVQPTLTAAADWRSFDTNVNSGFAYHSSGTAPSRFGGVVQVVGDNIRFVSATPASIGTLLAQTLAFTTNSSTRGSIDSTGRWIIGNFTDTASSGMTYPVTINATYNQTGTAGSTDFRINRTETANGSGVHRFLVFERNSSEIVSISRLGDLVTRGFIETRNGTDPTAILVNNTWTSDTNRETGFARWNSNVFLVGTEKGSVAGSARALALQTDGLTRLTVAATGDITVAQALTVVGNLTAPIGTTPDLMVGTGASGILETKTPSQARAAIGLNTASITLEVDGKDAVIPVGNVKGHIFIPFACTITEWEIVAHESGSMVVDLWKDTYANNPPTDADSITGSAKPTLTASQRANSTTLTGWTTALNAGDYLEVEIESNSAITWFTLVLKVTRT